MNVITSTSLAPVDTANAVPPSKSTLAANAIVDGVAFCVILTFIVCPACMFDGVNVVEPPAGIANVKKFPNEQSIVVVPATSVNTPTSPTTEPDTTKSPITSSEPVISALPVYGKAAAAAVVWNVPSGNVIPPPEPLTNNVGTTTWFSAVVFNPAPPKITERECAVWIWF
jgi:hypothetical protein